MNLAEGEIAACTFFNIRELRFTGPNGMLLPLLVGGLASLLVGLFMLLMPRGRKSVI